MNKDVIYIEPEDDITDIITKIEKAKEKIVALVPPKKAGVFRSIVNIKLIAKAGASAEKTVVLVTVDPSIIKLAAATKLPVAKNLQTAPVIPDAGVEESNDSHTIEDLPDSEEEEEAAEEIEEAKPSESKSSKAKKHDAVALADDADDEDDEEEADEVDEPEKKQKKSKKSAGGASNKLLGRIKLHKKLSIFSGVFAVALICFLVWALGFAPAVDITVAIKTDPRNFSETVNFVSDPNEEDAKEGKIFLEQKKYDNTQEIDFEATGQKNLGEKAIGELVVYAYFKKTGDSSRDVTAGTVFTYNGMRYVAVNNVSLSWDGKDDSCDNKGRASNLVLYGCQITRSVKVEASNPGAQYNVGASTSGWSTLANVAGVYSEKPITGGSDKMVTVVQQSDVLKAEEQLTTAKEAENKQKLYSSISDDYYIIEVSFEQNTSSSTATPGVDQEVTDGVTPKLSATTTASVYVVEKSKVNEYIKQKVDLEDNQKIYDIKDIYIESFSQSGSGFTGRLKAQYFVGPKITETEVVDKVKGKGLGDAQREIRDIYGVSDVKMDTSYPWVMAVPGDSNKVTVRFDVKDQDGKEIKTDTESENNDEADEENGDETKETKE